VSADHHKHVIVAATARYMPWQLGPLVHNSMSSSYSCNK